jgi:hypothetical protein
MSPQKNGHLNGSSSKKDELDRGIATATHAMDAARESLNRLIEELNKPRQALEPVRVGRGDRNESRFRR